MRTTLNIEDDAFSKAQAYASARSLKLGQAVSELIRYGAGQSLPIKQNKSGAWVFELPNGTPKASAKQVKDLLEEDL